MRKDTPYLDCCEKPVLETVKSFLSTECDMAAIRRCRQCGCNWFYRLKEPQRELDFIAEGEGEGEDADRYDRQIWYVRLTPEEVASLMKSDAVPEPRLFADRPGFVRDADGMNTIQGIPYFLK